jgi:hypothetical protein
MLMISLMSARYPDDETDINLLIKAAGEACDKSKRASAKLL